MANKMERFTQRARRVLSLAQEEAERFEHKEIDSEHMLMGLVREQGGVAGRVLRDLGLTEKNAEMLFKVLTRDKLSSSQSEYELSLGCKKILELAVDEARRRGHHYIGTEHLLLGLARYNDGISSEILKLSNISPEEVRRQTRRILQETPLSKTPPVPISTPSPVQQNPHIFISYRRADSADVSGRIYDHLTLAFDKPNIFKDVDNIPLGADFRKILDTAVAECNVMLAIIGSQWVTAKDNSGMLRLDNPADFVRLEIEAALNRDIPLIPILVRGAVMPTVDQLPLSLASLCYRNGIPVRSDPDFHNDIRRLISGLQKQFEKLF